MSWFEVVFYKTIDIVFIVLVFVSAVCFVRNKFKEKD
jgi:hypothetical protein